jgi:hypothetical protein
MTVKRRIATSLSAVVAAAALVGLGDLPAGAATPKANTVYKGDIKSTSSDISGTVKIVIGGDKSKVAKMTVKLVCDGEKVKLVRKNIAIKDDGSFVKQTFNGPAPFPVTQVDGKFKSKSKVTGGVAPDSEGPCGFTYLSYTATSGAERATAARLPGADGAYPLKNTTYTGLGEVASHGYTLKVKIKIGSDITKVAKMTAKLRCPEGKQKAVRKNLAIDEKGYIDWDYSDPFYFFGQFTTRHKVDRGSVHGDETQPCSDYVVNYIAKD